MKKSNIIVVAIVAIVCVISGIFIFMPNNNTAFESYYKEIKRQEKYQETSSYLKISVTRHDKYVDFIFTDANEKLIDINILIVPEDATLKFSDTFLSVGILEEYSINLYPKSDPVEEVNQIWKDGIGASRKTKDDEFLIYLSFKLENGNQIKEYIEIEVED